MDKENVVAAFQLIGFAAASIVIILTAVLLAGAVERHLEKSAIDEYIKDGYDASTAMCMVNSQKCTNVQIKKGS
ncbi:MAG: hypothetical protein HQL86_07500 [Magnetococcales bacterium]|nr:hypothetical protein [Magnetococcales bacterium]